MWKQTGIRVRKAGKMKKKKTLDLNDILIGIDLTVVRLKGIRDQQTRDANFAGAYETSKNLYDIEQAKQFIIEQQEIIKKYHKADMFLHAHGWRWDE